MRAVGRAVILSDDGRIAWFDEDLDTENLGPSRGSGAKLLLLFNRCWLKEIVGLLRHIPQRKPCRTSCGRDC